MVKVLRDEYPRALGMLPVAGPSIASDRDALPLLTSADTLSQTDQ